ncbi:MAG: ATP-binding protein [Neisseriaceae bacterium]|nr:ATP-binding protein [Neisseriaceae bacterium]
MKRHILHQLIQWKNNPQRKPLLLTGVRQCGKTHILKELGNAQFDDMCYINFESNQNYAMIFDYDFNVERIIKEIELLQQCKITAGKTLLIFDEIQDAPRAITALKYFCENMPQLHIACAGSLLGVALKKENISFPVGKVNRLSMYPMSFDEFIIAMGEEKYIQLFENWQTDREIPSVYTEKFERLLKEYYIVGGMPAVVQEYINTKDFENIKKIQNDILQDYADDFSKHAPVSEIEKIRMIWHSVPKQLAKENNKFVFSHVKQGKRANELEAALQWLKNAGLIHLLELVSNAEMPLSSNANATYFKVYMSDIGLLCRSLGLEYQQIIYHYDTLSTFKGAIVENYVLNELLQLNKNPYFWRSGNSAELDFLIEEQGNIIPIEVKSTTNTQAKSYRQFCKKYQPKLGYKLSLKNIGKNTCEQTQTISLPLYLLWKMGK